MVEGFSDLLKNIPGTQNNVEVAIHDEIKAQIQK
jgi:hypothetical protein